MRILASVIYLFLLLLAAPAKAEILVLVHGFMGGPASWENSHVNDILAKNGWNRAGILIHTSSGTLLKKRLHPPAKNFVYSVDLPSNAPVMLQADMLHNMLNGLNKRHPRENITLIGHSAGGIVARVALVKFGKGNVDRLITIASPHLGTGLAEYALNEVSGSGPVGMVKSFFGGTKYKLAKQSTGLLIDLLPPRPGNLLYWLNRQRHPDIDYISIVRGDNAQNSGDVMVPGFSQDMNNVPALRGKVNTWYLPVSHELQPLDGEVLGILLEDQLEPD